MSSSISATELAMAIASGKGPRLLDVREAEEHHFAALAGSKWIPLRELPGRLYELAEWKDKECVVYCHHGVRSLHAIQFLRQHGFSRLQNLTGGIDAWSLMVDPKLPRY